MIFILIFVENCLLYDALLDSSLGLRNGSNPVVINRFRSHTGNADIPLVYLPYCLLNKNDNIHKSEAQLIRQVNENW